MPRFGMGINSLRGIRVPKLRRSWIALFTAFGVLAAAGVAAADDTLINIGYDEENHVLIVNTSPTNAPLDCTLQNGPLRVGYGAVESGPIPVDTLEIEVEEGLFEAFQFLNRPAEEVDTDEFTPAVEPAKYTAFDGECGLTGGVVGGPNGQINHGQFMKLFHQLAGKEGGGCLNRVMAQSDFGKGDQQLRTSDVDPEFEYGKGGTVEFLSFEADCKHDKRDKGEDHPGRGSNRADSPGKSGDAKGRNK